ncbi:MAG: hypothetical protein WCT85_04290 [Parachlamydiales bacterium]|jgi:hypothetical protein
MSTIFLTKAHEYTSRSIEEINNKKYFQSWVDTLPARAYYLADVIANICCTPFTLLKTAYYSIEAGYTWGYEAKNFNQALENLYNNVNNTISSSIGIVFTSKGKELNKKNNIKSLAYLILLIGSIAIGIFTYKNNLKNEDNIQRLLSLAFSIGSIAIGLFAYKSEGLYYYYNISNGTWEPYFYLDVAKIIEK